jgi:hypothetical protein
MFLTLGILGLAIALFVGFNITHAAPASTSVPTGDPDEGAPCTGTGATQTGNCNTDTADSGTDIEAPSALHTATTITPLATTHVAATSSTDTKATPTADSDAGLACSGSDGPSQVGDCITQVGDQTGLDTGPELPEA